MDLLTGYIMERYDSLPRVDERSAPDIAEENLLRPTLNVVNVINEGEEATVSWTTNGEEVLVAMNDALLGKTNVNSVTLGGLDRSVGNVVTLTPVKGDYKGESVVVELRDEHNENRNKSENENAQLDKKTDGHLDEVTFFIPKAPNTGRGELAKH